MAKTIKEMAKEDAKYWCSTPGSDGTKEELVAIGIMRGANAVLEEFEKIILDDDFLPMTKVHRARVLIKELKG